MSAAATATTTSSSIFSPEHPNPTWVNTSDPLPLFVIQLSIIIITGRFFSLILTRLRQPRVIGEILAGIVLGPSVMYRVPGFHERIFPQPSIAYLTLVSDIGLCAFLFTVGLEVDFTSFRKNARVSASVAGAGLVLPFALGWGVAYGLWKEFVDPEAVSYHSFGLFIATASSITAFPVLARILTELNLVNDPVGQVVLAAGVANDVVGWILLALSIALAGASSGIVVLYIILTGIGWALALWFVVRPIVRKLAERDGSLDGTGPTPSMVCLVLLVVFVSSFMTDMIGIAALFGAFLAGVCMPKQREFVHGLVERTEDLVTTLLVPIYFTLSGLKCNLGLLNTGIIWGYVFCVMCVAFSGKFIGASVSAYLSGYSFRESGAAGSLMACKGLIELIVLNIGLSAGIISETVFSIFVLEALVLTFASTPLTLLFYPPHIRRGLEPAGAHLERKILDASGGGTSFGSSWSRLVVVLERMEDISSLMILSRLFESPPATCTATLASDATVESSSPPSLNRDAKDEVSIASCRLVELTDRTSRLMKASEMEDTAHLDPLSSLFGTYASLNGIAVRSTSVDVKTRDKFAETVARRAQEADGQLILLPWSVGPVDDEGALSSIVRNPLENLFGVSADANPRPQYASFIRDLFAKAPCDVGLFLHRPLPGPVQLKSGTHLFVPFFGGPDDRACLELALQVVQTNPGAVTATVLRLNRAAEATDQESSSPLSPRFSIEGEHEKQLGHSKAEDTIHQTVGGAMDTQYPHPTAAGATSGGGELGHAAADEVALSSLRELISQRTLPLALEEMDAFRPLQAALTRAKELAAARPEQRVVALVGRARRAASSHRKEVVELLKAAHGEGKHLGIVGSADVRKALGDAGTGMVLGGGMGGVLVVQRKVEGAVRANEGTD